MKRALTPDELNGLEELGYNTSTYKGELVEFPDPEQTSSAGGAALRSLVSGAIPATAGAAGFAGGMAAGAAAAGPLGLAGGPFAPVTVPAAAIVGGIGGGMLASGAAKWVQDALTPQSILDRNAVVAAEHPVATKVGELGAMALTMRPSISVTKDAIKGIPQLIPSVGGKTVVNIASREALKNVGLGAGISGATETGRQLVSGESLDPAAIARETVIGAAFNKPTALGHMVMRSQPTVTRTVDDPVAFKKTFAEYRPPQMDEHVNDYRDTVVGKDRQNDVIAMGKAALEEVALDNAQKAKDIETLKKNQEDLQKGVTAALEEARYQIKEVSKATTPLQDEVTKGLLDQKLSPGTVTPANKAAVGEVLRAKNLPVEENTGLDAKGRITTDKTGKNRITINPALEDVSTRAHEGVHDLHDRLRSEASKGSAPASKLLANLEALQEKARLEFNAKRAAEGKPPVDVEEFSTLEQGYEFVKQQLNMKKEGEWRRWWNDTKAIWNVRYGKNPSIEEVRRAMNFRFVHETGGNKGTISGVSGDRNMSSDEGFNSAEGDEAWSNSGDENTPMHNKIPQKPLPDSPSLKELVEAAPEQIVEWKKRVKFGPHHTDAIAAKMSREDYTTLKQEHNLLDQREKEVIRKMGSAPTSEELNKIIQDYQVPQLKKQTLRETMYDYERRNPGEFPNPDTRDMAEGDGLETPEEKKSRISPRRQKIIDDYKKYEEELNKKPLAQRQAEGGRLGQASLRPEQRKAFAEQTPEAVAKAQPLGADATRNTPLAERAPFTGEMGTPTVNPLDREMMDYKALNTTIDNALVVVQKRIRNESFDNKRKGILKIKDDDLQEIKDDVRAELITNGLDKDENGNPDLWMSAVRRASQRINKYIERFKAIGDSSLDAPVGDSTTRGELIPDNLTGDDAKDVTTAADTTGIGDTVGKKSSENKFKESTTIGDQLKKFRAMRDDVAEELRLNGEQDSVELEQLETVIEKLEKLDPKSPATESLSRDMGSEDGLSVREQQQNSPEFKEWFGDSKVVDKDGKPQKMFHGSPVSGITIFKPSRRSMFDVDGIWMAGDPNISDRYKGVKGQGSMYALYASIKNPLTLDKYRSLINKGATRESLIKDGYDGLIIPNDEGGVHMAMAFHPNQIKSATGNSGKFDPKNPDIRKQGADDGLTAEEAPLEDRMPYETDNSRQSFLRPMAGTFDKVRTISVPHAEAANKYEARKDQYAGKGNAAMVDLEKFSQADVDRVMNEHRKAYRDNETPVLDGKNDQEISAILQKYYGEIADTRRTLGIKVEGREGRKHPYYVPDMLNAETIDLFVNKAASPEALYAKKKWIDYVVKESDGHLNEAKVTKDISDYIAAIGGKENTYYSLEFGAIRRASGYGLPEGLRDSSALNVLGRYSRRAAADLAFFQEIQSKPGIAGPLKIKDQRGNIPKEHQNSPLSEVKDIQHMMQWITGSVTGRSAGQTPKLNAVVRLVNNSLLGGPTGIRDLVSVPVNALPYIHRFSDLGAAWKGLTETRQNSRAALETAARQPNIDRIQFDDIKNQPDKFTTIVGKLADGMRKVQGREFLENLSRDIVFSVGKELGRNNILGAKAGNVKSEQWLKKFGDLIEGDITSLEGADLEAALNQIGKNFTDRNQGTYGGRGLPIGIVDSQFAPFLSLQKWSVEKSNVIYKDVYKPFITGENRLPMLTYALGSFMTGAAIQQLNQLMTGRKGQEPNLKEALNADSARVKIAELATIMQLGSYAGVLSDSLKTLSDVGLRGTTPRNIVSFPTATAAIKTGESVTDMLEAMRQGEDPWEVLKMFSLDMMTSNVQNLRAIANHTWKTEDIERSDKFRDSRVFNEIEGKPSSNITKTNPYLGIQEKKFKRTKDPREAVKLARELVKEAVVEAKGNPREVRRSLASLKGNSYQTMPSPLTNPDEFKKFYNFVAMNQGKEAADERVKDFTRQSMFNKQKSKLIP